MEAAAEADKLARAPEASPSAQLAAAAQGFSEQSQPQSRPPIEDALTQLMSEATAPLVAKPSVRVACPILICSRQMRASGELGEWGIMFSFSDEHHNDHAHSLMS